MPFSRKAATARFLDSLAEFEGVDGAFNCGILLLIKGNAAGRARKNLCVYFRSSSRNTTTAAAPAVYANIREEERLSNPVGEVRVFPMILFSDSPDS